MKKHFLRLLIALSAFVFFACEDSGEEIVDTDVSQETQIATDILFATMEMDEIYRSVDAVFAQGNGRVANSSCTEIIFDFENNTFTFDYGDGCYDSLAGVERKGKISISFSSDPANPTAGSFTLSFDNYEVDGISIDGTTSSTVIGFEDGSLSVKRTADLSVGYADGAQTSVKSDLTYVWQVSAGEVGTENGVLQVSGNVSGTSREGYEYTMKITTPYETKTTCLAEGFFFPTSGVGEYTVTGESDFTVDFGDGTCDNLAVISVGPFSKEIELQ